MSTIQLLIGHVTDTTARIWVRSTQPKYAHVTVSLNGTAVWSDVLEVNDWNALVGVREANGLSASTKYAVGVRFTSTKKKPPAGQPDVSGSFSTFPPSSSVQKFTFLLGSCNLDGETPFTRINNGIAANESPSFMLHCGDQIYADVPSTAIDVGTDLWRKKYVQAWSGSAAQAFLGNYPQYMVLDDHEVANNFKNHMSPISAVKGHALKAYGEFQHSHNPQTNGALHYYYEFAHGRVQFFVTDVRTERVHDGATARIMSAGQLKLLLAWLLKHRDAVKFVVTSVPFVGEVEDSDDKWNAPAFLAQRGEVLDFIYEHGITGVVFLTGDMHNSYHARLRFSDPNGPIVHELMSSPLGQILTTHRSAYLEPPPVRTTPKAKLTYQGQIVDYYSAHSNVMAIGVDGREVSYRIYRTRANGGAEAQGKFTV